MKRKGIVFILVFTLVFAIFQTLAYASEECTPCTPCDDDPCCCCCSPKTIGYWKNHAGSGNGKQENLVQTLICKYGSIYLGTIEIEDASSAVDYLKMNGDASNGINKLLAQLLAAKLNKESGCRCCPILDCLIKAADNRLAGCPNTEGDDLTPEKWYSLSPAAKNEILYLAEKLDQFNNGLLCD